MSKVAFEFARRDVGVRLAAGEWEEFGDVSAQRGLAAEGTAGVRGAAANEAHVYFAEGGDFQVCSS